MSYEFYDDEPYNDEQVHYRGFDIFGCKLRVGYCEVHPNTPEEYPCSQCLDDSQRVEYEKSMNKEYEDYIAKEYAKHLQKEYEQAIGEVYMDMFYGVTI